MYFIFRVSILLAVHGYVYFLISLAVTITLTNIRVKTTLCYPALQQ